jgi:hypothetical protein
MTNFALGDMPIPGPPWLFLTFLFLIFWLHVIAIWLLIGSLIVGIIGLLKDKVDWQKSKTLSYLPIVMALAINLGVPPLLFLQVLYAPFFFSSAVLIAVPWLSIFFLLLLGYGMIYAARYGAKKHWQAIAYLGVSLISVLLISFIFSNNMTLMIKPSYWQQMYSYKQNGLHLYPNLPELVSRWIWVLAPIFIAGATLLKRSKKWGIATAIISILALLAYRNFLSPQVLGNSLVNIGSIADFALAGVLLILSLVPIKNEKLTSALFWSWLSLKSAAVVTLRHGVRTANLDPVYDLAKLPMQAQPVLIGIFCLILTVGLFAVIWMYIKGRKELSI